MIWLRNSSALPNGMYSVAIFTKSGIIFSRYLSGSLMASATSRRKPARCLVAAPAGSSNTSISTCVALSISAGKPINTWPAWWISISSGSSPNVQAVWRGGGAAAAAWADGGAAFSTRCATPAAGVEGAAAAGAAAAAVPIFSAASA